jgi:hypothetical protein
MTDFIFKSNKKVSKQMVNVCNIIGDTPDNVAKKLCPSIEKVEGTNLLIEYSTQFQYGMKFLKSKIFGVENKFFDNEGNWIYKE